MTLPITVNIPSEPQIDNLILNGGEITLIAGANGVGKSALLYQLYKSIPQGQAGYYPGHRQITFNNGWDNLQQDLGQMANNMYASPDAFSRYKGVWSEDQFKSIVRKVQNIETKYNRDIIERIKIGDGEAIREIKENVGPIKQMNGVFAAAGLVVSLSVDAVGLLVSRGSYRYRIDQMSDGERAAFFLVGAILAQDSGTIIMIDEPERHLHPSISGPLVQAAVRMRTDISYIFSTHDLNLLDYMSDSRIIYITDSVITNPRPEQRSYSAVYIDPSETFPEGVKVDLLGVRKRVMFVEGEKSSIDREIYSRIYADWKVIPRGGWEKCVEAVRALSGNETLHWLESCAIIDSDGKASEEVLALAEGGIFALPCPTVENIFFRADVIHAVGTVLHRSSGPSADERLDSVRQKLGKLIKSNIDEMVVRQTVWRISRMLSERKVSVQQIRSGLSNIQGIDVEKLKEEISEYITDISSNSDSVDALWHLPIKNSELPAKIANWVGASSFKSYCEVVLRQLDLKSDAGEIIRVDLQRALPAVRPMNSGGVRSSLS